MRTAALLMWSLACSTGIAAPVTFDPSTEMICTAPPPPGTGLRADGHGAIHLPKPGFYEFVGGIVGSTPGRRWYAGGSYAGVEMRWSAPLEWIRPDGVREVVPVAYLYPPF